ncbi:MAG: AMP-binding protein [Firmicutes bacterium]|nr:AMP-binding protein [Bacillota bacterium]
MNDTVNEETMETSKPVRIPVPHLKPIREMPKYKDIRELLDGCKDRFGEDIAYIIKTKKATKSSPAEYKNVSFTRLREEVDLLGAAFLRLGLKDKRLAIIGKNRYEWMLGYYAQLCGLGITVPLDKGLPLEELEFSLIKAKADALLFDKDHLDLVNRLKTNVDCKDMLFICMDECEGFLSIPELLKESEALGEEALAEYRALPVDGNALSIILFTSGTSGLAKAVELTQYNITHNVWSVLSVEDLRHGDINMAFLPYHHTFGSTGQTMMSCAGMTTVFCDSLKAVQKNMVEYKVSVFICVPLLIEAMYKRIIAEVAKQGKTKKFNFGLKLSRFLLFFGIDARKKLFKEVMDKLGGNLRYVVSGASPLDPEVAKGFTDLGVTLVQGYGMTEAAPVLSAENLHHIRFGSIGMAIPEVELMIENPNENGVGELIARGHNVMRGYYENPEATDEMLRDGWLYTGDLASMDKDGYLTIRGRSKNVIVLKNGKNIYPEEIETLVGRIPYVLENMVFGEPREVGGDAKDLVLSVKIVYDPDAIKETRGAETKEQIEAAVAEDIRAISESLPRYKQIHRRYITTEPMEKTTTGKVKRYKQKI